MSQTLNHYLLNVGEHDKTRLSILSDIYNSGSRTFIERSTSHAPTHILDIGCGHGQMTQWLAEQFPQAQVTGMDVSTEQLDMSRANCSLPNVSFVQHDFTQGILKHTSVDLVYIRYVLLHIKDWQAFFDNLLQSIAPDAKILLEEPGFPFFCYPSNEHLDKANRLGCQLTQQLGLNYDCIEPLWHTVTHCERFKINQVSFTQPLLKSPEEKSILWRSFIQIAQPLVALGFATEEEVSAIVDELFNIANDQHSIVGSLRLIQLDLSALPLSSATQHE
ncbi:class I SAM-dependent methyltransferase [Pseudomonas sp. SIMBA_077]